MWVVLFLLLTLLASPGGATEFYTTPTASSTTPPCTTGNPCSRAYVLANAVAGDTVYYKAGTYVGENIPTNSGVWNGIDCTSVITFRADPAAGAGTVILQNGYTANPGYFSVPRGTFRVVGADGLGRSCLQIGPGFTFSGDSWAPQVAGCAGGGCPAETTYRGNTVTGNTFTPGNTSGPGDATAGNNSVVGNIGQYAAITNNAFSNSGGVYQVVAPKGGAIVTGNTFIRDASPTGTGTSGQLEINESVDIGAQVVNNHLIASGGVGREIALWCDNTGGYGHWINNYVEGFWANGIRDEFNCFYNRWKYNIWSGSSHLIYAADGVLKHGATLENNTLYNMAFKGYQTHWATDVTFRNNILMQMSQFHDIDARTFAGPQQTVVGTIFDYNVYCTGAGCSASDVAFALNPDGNGNTPADQNFTQWAANTGVDESHSVVANPLLTNPAGGDFSIPTNSPAYQTGFGGGNIGACPGNTFACGTPTAVPTMTLTATPATISQGHTTVLTWGSATATQGCSAPWTRSTGSYGFARFQPMVTTDYTLTCTNSHGNTATTVTVTVTPPVTTPTPVAWYKLNASSGTTADDAGPNNLDGTLINGTTWGTGQLGNGAVFDGVDDGIQIPNTAALNPTNAIAVTAWVRYTSAGTLPATIVSKDDFAAGGVSQYALTLGYESTTGKRIVRWRMHNADDRQQSTVESQRILDPGTWYHLAATSDGVAVALYINGGLETLWPVNGSGILGNNGFDLFLGRRNNGLQPFTGTLDDVRIYAQGLTQADIQAIMAATSLPPTLVITAPTSTPTYSTSTSPLTTLAGTASDDVAVPAGSVTWACPTCTPTSGTAAGTTSWTVASIGLASGDNVLTVTVTDGDGQRAVDQLTVTYTPGTTAPTCTITAPNGGSNTTVSSTPLTTLAGTASDDVAVSTVAVACSPSCGSPTVSGTTSWSVASLPLQVGDNVITCTATDGESQQGTDQITVTYTPPAASATSPASVHHLGVMPY